MGGADEHVSIARHGFWFDEPVAHPGLEIPDGAASGARIVAMIRNGAVIHLDLFGVGAKTYGWLMALQLQVVGVDFAAKMAATDTSGRLHFFNLRSWAWWQMREALDPLANNGIALPPNRKLRADLCAPKFSVPQQQIKVEGREELVKRLGRSADYGTAAILALMDTPKRAVAAKLATRNAAIAGHDPYAVLDLQKSNYGHDPYR